MTRLTWANAIWLVCYFAMINGIVVSLVRVRERVLTEMSTPEARQKWQDWREEARRQTTGEGPVQRRMPSSPEPPALVLMRDRFAMVVTAGIVFSTVFFVFMMILVRGVMNSRIRRPGQTLPALPSLGDNHHP